MRYFISPKNLFLAALALMVLWTIPARGKEPEKAAKPAAESKADEGKAGEKPADTKTVDKPATDKKKAEVDLDDELALEKEDAVAVARPVQSEPVQVYGWREKIVIDGVKKPIYAKLDTGAYTSSIHAEEKELFERDGKKWVRFIVTEPRKKGSPRVRIEAPLTRIARVKNPGGKSETREVVRLAFKIGDRKMRGDFTLNNRSNMLSAVLIGRTAIKQLGWIDSSRTNLADDKVMR